MAEPAPEGARG